MLRQAEVSCEKPEGCYYARVPHDMPLSFSQAKAALCLASLLCAAARCDALVKVFLKLAPSGTGNIGANATATVTIHDLPADQWRLQNFGAAANSPAANDTGDWVDDGIMNLLEDGLNLEPKVSDAPALPQATLADGYLTLSFVPNPTATDLHYVEEGSTDPIVWSTNDVENVPSENTVQPTRQTFRYHYSGGTIGGGLPQTESETCAVKNVTRS